MSIELINHISKHISIDRKDLESVAGFFTPVQAKKKENLVTAGLHCKYNYFVVKGCMRMYFITEHGSEQTIQFALENWWMTDLEAFNKGKTASLSVQTIESCELLAIDKPSMEKMLATHPQMERYFRMIYERAYSASLFRVQFIFQFSKEDSYLHFSNAYPNFVQRIPQKILASFLGFTPEYLSELRRKRVKIGLRGKAGKDRKS
ncbi:Crp/Fnr family transcriptional regulator [Terrimonas sp. NA20]|uniref:Crp/Fnr family transcriptional regulator n=1 Tax=Terrimonas ginsenosidimutans TaxID=2908004 RepID=A0ABS9KPP4_9BACT|nr:Crp/Fnr family transcriptional regulator [Terrimonas ginsenosidimutans]MCG2614274.1 Crp/Fnr family transcriptional regulator [Terrimonas ginsenosidimutans]